MELEMDELRDEIELFFLLLLKRLIFGLVHLIFIFGFFMLIGPFLSWFIGL